MREWKSQAHVRWYCRYHIVLIPKFRKEVGKILRKLCERFGIELVEGNACADHINMCLGTSPKCSVANAMGKLKGKSAVLIHRRCLNWTKNLTGYHFGARGYCVSTVGLDEYTVRQYIRDQEKHELQVMQFPLD